MKFKRLLKRLADIVIPPLIELEINHKPDLSDVKGALLAVNHVHALDPLFVSYAVYPVWLHHVAKYEIFRIPFLPLILKRLGVIPVNRERPGKYTVKKSLELFSEGKIVCIFPQGTRRKKNFGKIKKGAARLALAGQVPIYPVAISGLENVRFWGFFKHPKVRISFGEPINIQGRENTKEEIGRLTDYLEERMKELYKQIYF